MDTNGTHQNLLQLIKQCQLILCLDLETAILALNMLDIITDCLQESFSERWEGDHGSQRHAYVEMDFIGRDIAVHFVEFFNGIVDILHDYLHSIVRL